MPLILGVPRLDQVSGAKVDAREVAIVSRFMHNRKQFVDQSWELDVPRI
jgi:hypothetical protein